MFGSAQKPQDLLNLLEQSVSEEITAYKYYIDQLIENENARLRWIGVPVPRLVSEFSYQIKPYFYSGIGAQKESYAKNARVSVKFIAPVFEYAPHRVFHINKYKLYLTVFGDLEQALKDCRARGLKALIDREEYDCFWTNRTLFNFYQSLEYAKDKSVTCELNYSFNKQMQKDQTRGIHSKALEHPPLEAIPALSYEEAADVNLRAQLYTLVTNDEDQAYSQPETFYDMYYGVTEHMPPDLIMELPVPCTQINCNYLCSKIIVGEAAVKPSQMIEFLNSLRSINNWIYFQLWHENKTAYFQLRYPEESKNHVFSKLNLYFPDFEWIDNNHDETEKIFPAVCLKKTSLYDPIRKLRDFQLDPFAHLASFFETSVPDEQLCYQVIFAPLAESTAATLKHHLTQRTQYGQTDLSEKFARKLPLWFVSFSVQCSDSETVEATNKTKAIIRAKAVAEVVATTVDSPNQVFSKPDIYYSQAPFPQLTPTFISLMETDELAALAHFPISPLSIEGLETTSMKNAKPPEIYTLGDTRIGQTKVRGGSGGGGEVLPVTLPDEVRDRHVYIVGKSGTGKSTLMETIARRDIEEGRGVAVIDPHGDLVEHLLKTMPQHRAADCILFSPKRSPFSLEILGAENEHEIDLLSDDLITMFRRTSESWGDKMQAILQMAFQTLLRVPGSSFTDITPLLTDENYRNRIISKINHPQLASFWLHRYDVRQAEPILIRMDRLTTSGVLRQVLTQNRNSLNFYDVITESKVFLADLSKGFLGESTSHLLGSIIVSQIQLAAMRQAQLPIEQRIAFSLFVDEVQNFTTSAFTTILSEARKQKLRLTIAHQFVSQLPTEIQKAVFGNVGTLMFFAMSPDDLGAARHELGQFDLSDVANLPKYNALCRPVTAARDTFSFATDPPPPAPEWDYSEWIIKNTLSEYGAPVTAASFVEAEQSRPVQTNEAQPVEQSETVSPPAVDRRRPAPARPVSFATNTEKILHFVRQAEYLSQPQIIALTELLPPNASTALKKLCETGQIKSLDDRRPKIYFVGRTCNATTHNLLIRDLLVKIYASGFDVRAVKFNETLSEINPDLAVEFIAEDTTPLLCYFELDRGTEGVAELVKKADRYAQLSDNNKVCFVFERDSDMQLARTRINYPFISYAVLNDFTSLRDEAFYAAGAATHLTPFFGS